MGGGFHSIFFSANFSAHRQLTEMSLYFLESSGHPLSISTVSCLWAEKIAEKKIGWNPPPPHRRENILRPLEIGLKISYSTKIDIGLTHIQIPNCPCLKIAAT